MPVQQPNGEEEPGGRWRSMVAQNSFSWPCQLLWMEYAPNTLTSLATGLSPFQCAYGFQPPLFSARRRGYLVRQSSPSPTAAVKPEPECEYPCCMLLTSTQHQPTDIALLLPPTRLAKMFSCPPETSFWRSSWHASLLVLLKLRGSSIHGNEMISPNP